MSITNNDLLKADARNRTLRTFVQGLAIDVGVALAIILYNVFDNSNSWSAMDWAAIGFSLARTFVQSAAAYVMRAFLDRSSVPTPLPPAPVAVPADPVDPV